MQVPAVFLLMLALGCSANAAPTSPADLQSPAGVSPTSDTRIRITQSMLPLSITISNSYYFGSLLVWNGATPAITINTVNGTSPDNKVTIDLNGFELRRTVAGAAPAAIVCVGASEGDSVHIYNGTLSGWNNGIDQPGYGLNVHHVGFTRCTLGIRSAGGATISDCTFNRCDRAIQILGAQSGQTFQGGSIVTRCAAHLCTNPYYGGVDTIFRDCQGYNIAGTVFDLIGSSTVDQCSGSGSVGVRLDHHSVVTNSRFSGCLSAGIQIDGDFNRVVDNHVTGSGSGAGLNQVGIAFGGVAKDNYLAGNTVAHNYNLNVLRNYQFSWLPNSLNLVLTQVPQSITMPCNIKLGGDLIGVAGLSGITVQSDDVTIDLNGHTLGGVSGSTDGIAVPSARRNLRVLNGTLRYWGSTGAWASNVTGGVFERVTFDQNGQHGLLAGSSSRIEACSAVGNGQTGISCGAGSLLRGCLVRSNVSSGIYTEGACQVNACTASQNGRGLDIGDGSLVVQCTSSDNSGSGILARNGCRISECNVRNNAGEGIRVAWSCFVLQNDTNGNGTGGGNQGGIAVTGNSNRIEGNNCSFDDLGILVSGVNNIILRNTANNAPVSIATGNSYGPWINVIGAGDFAGVAGSTHPAANFFF